MKPSLSCVYWILLIISVVSSGLLFLIVASEGIKGSTEAVDQFSTPENISIEDSGGGGDHPVSLSSEIESQDVDKDKNVFKEKAPDSDDKSTSKDVKTEKLPAGLELLAEGLTQQPNLSQGIPETEQAVVLTLVDAAAAQLQSLASEPRISRDKRQKSVVSNLTMTLRESEPTQLPSPSRLPSLVNLDSEDSLETVKNLTNNGAENLLEDIPNFEERVEEVLVVRADQSSGVTEAPTNVLVDHQHPLPTPNSLETTSELPDSEARARLAGGAAEDASLMLDVLATAAGTDPHEDIPSFSEWAQKRLEEAEKKKTHPNASAQNPGGPGGRGTGSTKVRSKNYASPDCGSKIVAANPEAGSASSVLSSSRDEYMLNTCTSRVWFVVELCEAIQAEKIELANFELFSSSPKDFSVFVGDRFPSRDWSAVGQFTAKDERDIQSFALHPRLFGKFVKVELHSHYGSEHFCPVSLFRVYGTSEFEVLETENQIQESLGDFDPEDEEEMLDVDTGDPPRNLFGSARDAVLSIVKKAAEVLVKSGDKVNNNTKIQESIEDTILQNSLVAACMTPRYTVLCTDCTETMFAKVFQLVSCNDHYLASILEVDFFNRTLCRSNVCPLHEKSEQTVTKNIQVARFVTSLFPPQYLVALCNVLAARESRVILNTSYYATENNSEGAASLEDAMIAPPQGVPTTYEGSMSSANTQSTHCATEDNSQACKTSGVTEQPKTSVDLSAPTLNEVTSSSENVASLIKPTKTLTREDGSRKEPPAAQILEPSKKIAEESTVFEAPVTSSTLTGHHGTVADKVIEESGIQGTAFDAASQHTLTTPLPTESNTDIGDISGDVETSGETVAHEIEPEIESEMKISPQDQISLDTLLSDLKDLEADSVTMQNNPATPSATLSQPTPNHQQKESVFLRLSNRIKTLERNMSLSGQYLEELSKRYKKQVEEMQRSLERAITAMGEESRRGEERESKRLDEISELKQQVSILTNTLTSLLNDRDSWRSKFSLIGQHVVLVCVEIVVVLLVLSYCRRNGELEDEVEESLAEPEIKRRKSTEATTTTVVKKTKKRRPSEITARISGSYHELMIDESVKRERKRKRKRDAPVVTISDFPNIKPLRRESLNTLPGGTNFPSRRASSSDASKLPQNNLDFNQRPESAPETSLGWFNDQKETEKIEETVPEAKERGVEEITETKTPVEVVTTQRKSEGDLNKNISKPLGILKSRKISSPGFMKSALVTRSRRLSGKSDNNSSSEPLPILKSDNWEWYSKHSGSRSSQEDRASPTPSSTIRINVNGSSVINGRYEESDDSRSESATPTSGSRKDKKTSYGIKKMVKKFF